MNNYPTLSLLLANSFLAQIQHGKPSTSRSRAECPSLPRSPPASFHRATRLFPWEQPTQVPFRYAGVSGAYPTGRSDGADRQPPPFHSKLVVPITGNRLQVNFILDWNELVVLSKPASTKSTAE